MERGLSNQIMNILQMIKKRDAVYFNHMVRCSVVVMPNADLIELATFFNELHVNLIVNFVETYGLDDARFRQKAPNNSMDTLQNSLIERLSKEGISILSNSSSGKEFFNAYVVFPMLKAGSFRVTIFIPVYGAGAVYPRSEQALFGCRQLLLSLREISRPLNCPDR